MIVALTGIAHKRQRSSHQSTCANIANTDRNPYSTGVQLLQRDAARGQSLVQGDTRVPDGDFRNGFVVDTERDGDWLGGWGWVVCEQ